MEENKKRKSNSDSMMKTIMELSEVISVPDGSDMRVIEINATKKAAKIHNVPRLKIEIEALSSGVVPRRYLRNHGTFGNQGQVKLLMSNVAIVGIGGLGGTVARNLARVGVGRMTLIDGEVFDESNLNRQEFSLEDNIGRPKVEVAMKEVKRINGAVEVKVHNKYVTGEDLAEILKGVDVAVDALDNIHSRFAMGRAAKALKLPVVHGSVAGFVGQVSTIFPEDGGYENIYGPEDELPERGVEVVLGNLPGVVTTTAALQSVEVTKIILGVGEVLRNKILFFDLESADFETFILKEEKR